MNGSKTRCGTDEKAVVRRVGVLTERRRRHLNLVGESVQAALNSQHLSKFHLPIHQSTSEGSRLCIFARITAARVLGFRIQRMSSNIPSQLLHSPVPAAPEAPTLLLRSLPRTMRDSSTECRERILFHRPLTHDTNTISSTEFHRFLLPCHSHSGEAGAASTIMIHCKQIHMMQCSNLEIITKQLLLQGTTVLHVKRR